MKKTDKKQAVSKRKQPLAAENVSENKSEFALDEFKIDLPSSAEPIKSENISGSGEEAENSFLSGSQPGNNSGDINENLTKIENPIFRELAEPKLPVLQKENRARLQMQSPTRLHFFWSVKENPFETLHRIFGNDAENYTLVVKLFNQTNGREEISPIEAVGSSWFNVNADSDYAAEIGFYAASRPFVRLMFSNSVKTPRRNPSPRQASKFDWAVSADSFAQVLDNSGFAQDAFEVALAGDDAELAESSTRAAFASFFGDAEEDFTANDSGEMRFALLAVASGYSLENLREQISPSLFARLRENGENLNAEKALAVLQENFDVFTDEDALDETLAPKIFGASLINFPRRSNRFFRRNALPKISPVSSFN